MINDTSLLQQLEQAKREGNLEKEWILEKGLGEKKVSQGDHPQALEYYENALTVARQIGDVGKQAEILHAISNIYTVLDNAYTAMSYDERALKLVRRTQNQLLESDILSNLANSFDRLGDIPNSIKCYEQALARVRSLPTGNETTSTTNLLTPYLSIPDTRPLSQLPQKARSRNVYKQIFTVALVLLVIISTAYILINIKGWPGNACDPSNGFGNDAICSFQAPDGEVIGLSYGGTSFDSRRDDGSIKIQASNALKANDIQSANNFWQSSAKTDASDAEVLIYQENQRVLSTNHSSITIVVATMLSGDDASIAQGRSDLQGAYLAQKAFNSQQDKYPGSVEIRLLIANIGGESVYVRPIAAQILKAVSKDSTIVGVMGLPMNTLDTIDAVSSFSQAHIPVVSPTNSLDQLSKVPGFFRMVPPLKDQAAVHVQFAKNTLHAKTIAILYDPSDASYSQELMSGFTQGFQADAGTITMSESYTQGQPETLPDLLRSLLVTKPDLIYFPVAVDDVNALLKDLLDPSINPSNIRPQVMGGDNLYALTYSNNLPVNFNLLHLTALAYPGIWNSPQFSASKPSFFEEYPATFDPSRQEQNVSSHSVPTGDAMLSYDAMLVLLNACNAQLAQGKKTVDTGQLLHTLAMTEGVGSIQGTTGNVSFANDGNPVNKAISILSFNESGSLQIDKLYGDVLKTAKL